MADTRAHRGIQNPAYRPTVFSLGTIYVPGAIYIIYMPIADGKNSKKPPT